MKSLNGYDYSEKEVARELTKIANNESAATFLAATLAIEIDEEFILISPEFMNNSPIVISYLTSLIYIQNKTENHCYYERAKNVVNAFEEVGITLDKIKMLFEKEAI